MKEEILKINNLNICLQNLVQKKKQVKSKENGKMEDQHKKTINSNRKQ